MLRRGFLPPIGHLLAFEYAARHGSVSRAAEELHLTQSAVSRQIRHLEETLGVALFHRVRQRIVLTDAGRIYGNDIRKALEGLSDATHKVMAFAGTSGVLNLAVLPTFGTRWLVPRLPHFLAQHPDVTVNLSARLEPFDFSLEPFDAAVHFGAPHWPGAVCEHLMTEEVVPVCSPEYRWHKRIRTPDDLVAASLLQQSTRPTAWAEWFERIGVTVESPLKGPRFGQFAMVAQAAVAGIGAALVPRFLVEEELAAGRLEVVFDQSLPSRNGYYVVYPEAKATTPLVQAFSRWIVEQARGL